ncbi:MAG TPA: bifunctional folylpolyglutamate synthase/dihydrofolate synthase, partial [Methylomirabilota bacterium]|nr:bifunctional folylpolyglutamate synthase/dihydrofolate synthase [Methylomirabilota bacterium]
VIGVLGDKDARGILSALEPLAARVVLTASANPRAAAPESLRALLPAEARVDVVRSSREALALARAQDPTGVVCVAGSLSLIGDVLARTGQDVLSTAGAHC